MRSMALGLVALLLVAAVPVTANPNVPYCEGSVGGGATSPASLPEVCEQATSRVFPEAIARPEYAAAGNTGYAKDFVSFFEFEAGLNYLAAQHPDRLAIHQVGESYGLVNQVTQQLQPLPIYVAEITNFDSPVAAEDKLNLLFMLSIHGNEKGGREGGFRVLEDLVAGKGMALETVQNGAGMPSPLAKPTGGEVETYEDYLDFTRVFLLFPNADGWAHDEAEFAAEPCPGYLPTLFCRTNGNGTDLNRQLPTVGWQHVNANNGRLAMNEPEAKGYANWFLEHTWNYAIDIHGMLNHENFVAIMMPAGSFSPQEMHRSTRLAETLKERMNEDDHFAEWLTLLGSAGTLGDAAGSAIAGSPACAELGNFCPQSSPSRAVGSGEFADWSTVWDAIGYTDSGFSGDFFAQSSGLNAPGYDIELAYNHITVDSQYEAGAQFNDYHVHSVRHIMKSFLDAAALDVRISYDTQGTNTLVIMPDYVATNLDDVNAAGEPMLTPGGWADSNPHDDPWQYSADNPFFARPAKYFDDMRPFLRDGELPGVMTTTSWASVTQSMLDGHDTIVIPGTAINQFVSGDAAENAVAGGAPDSASIERLKAWVENGGNLVLTDAALEYLDLAGFTENGVGANMRYAGAIDMDREHPLTQKVRGEARQTYEPVPLGFAVGANAAPIWGVDPQQWNDLGGDAAGWEYGADAVSLGVLAHGDGAIHILGALLPDPTEEFYHPYGLDDYATTYSGNQILRNMLGWTEVFAAPPVVIEETGEIIQSENEPTRSTEPMPEGEGASADTPLPLAFVVLGLLVALVRRR